MLLWYFGHIYILYQQNVTLLQYPFFTPDCNLVAKEGLAKEGLDVIFDINVSYDNATCKRF